MKSALLTFDFQNEIEAGKEKEKKENTDHLVVRYARAQ